MMYLSGLSYPCDCLTRCKTWCDCQYQPDTAVYVSTAGLQAPCQWINVGHWCRIQGSPPPSPSSPRRCTHCHYLMLLPQTRGSLPQPGLAQTPRSAARPPPQSPRHPPQTTAAPPPPCKQWAGLHGIKKSHGEATLKGLLMSTLT